MQFAKSEIICVPTQPKIFHTRYPKHIYFVIWPKLPINALQKIWAV